VHVLLLCRWRATRALWHSELWITPME
jgi:hypothetical protein